jgi:hypothetical protein
MNGKIKNPRKERIKIRLKTEKPSRRGSPVLRHFQPHGNKFYSLSIWLSVSLSQLAKVFDVISCRWLAPEYMLLPIRGKLNLPG